MKCRETLKNIIHKDERCVYVGKFFYGVYICVKLRKENKGVVYKIVSERKYILRKVPLAVISCI